MRIGDEIGMSGILRTGWAGRLISAKTYVIATAIMSLPGGRGL